MRSLRGEREAGHRWSDERESKCGCDDEREAMQKCNEARKCVQAGIVGALMIGRQGTWQ